MYACTRSPSSRARQRLSCVRICLVMIPCLRWITATLPPLHAAECDARMRMKFDAAFPNLPNDSCTNGTRTQRSVSNDCESLMCCLILSFSPFLAANPDSNAAPLPSRAGGSRYTYQGFIYRGGPLAVVVFGH